MKSRWEAYKKNILPTLGAVIFIKLGAWYVFPYFKDKQSPPPNAAQIISSCIKTYRESGLTGLKVLSNKAYAELGKKPSVQDLEKVAIIDMFSYQLDNSIANYAGFPHDDYFSVEEFQGRIGVYFKEMNLTNDEINKNVRKWETAVNKEIERVFK